MPGTAIGYVRVSTVEQADSGVSLDAQEAAIRAYCAMRGLELVGIARDPGVSAGKPLGVRPEGATVVEKVRRREVDNIVAYKLDRLFRDAADCLAVTGAWDRAGVALHLVDMGGQAIDTSTAMGRFFLTVMAGAAEMERNLIRERTTAGLAHKKRRGERVGSIPYGMRLAADGVHLEPDSEEQGVVASIHRMRAAGKTQREIVATLNNTRTPARGQSWHLPLVQRILSRAA